MEIFVIFVMDYVFGEQVYEMMDELLCCNELEVVSKVMFVQLINIMGKVGIFEGGKGDIMVF